MVNLVIYTRYYKKQNMSFPKFIISLVMALAFGTYFYIYATNYKNLIINP